MAPAQQTLSRRGFLRASAVVTGLALTAACAPATAPATDSGAESSQPVGASTTIAYWTF